ncbi:MAG: ATP-binding protein [Chitinophagaceae bacterium]
MKALSSEVSEQLISNKNYYAREKAFPKFNDDEQEFIAFLAHEVRNPLANINLSVEMLNSIIEDTEEKKYLDIIIRNSGRINELITRLLTYQKPEKEEASHSVNSLLNEVLNIVDDRMKLKSITVIKTFSTDDFVIVTNEAKMKIAFTNLIINAIEAMPTAAGILKLSGKYVEDKYMVTIEDNGCGISEDNLQSIFDMGYTNKPGGLGFGLQITKTILLANNVEIKVASIEGKFTRFTLLFNK